MYQELPHLYFSPQKFKAIALLSVSKSSNISLVRTLTTSFYCQAICPMDGDRFIINTINHPCPVRTITVQGQEGDVQHACLADKTYKLDESKCTYIEAHKTVVLTDRYDHTVYLSNIENGMCHIVQIKSGYRWEPDPVLTALCLSAVEELVLLYN